LKYLVVSKGSRAIVKHHNIRRNWIALGEKRNSYIPSRPDEYYGRLGQWISWDHFLGKDTGEQEEKEEDDSINTAFS
jgi:hypothetical protein